MTEKEEQAVARLKDSKTKALETLYKEGEKAGAEYVSEQAEFIELERLERWHENIPSRDLDNALEGISFRALAQVMDAESEGDIEEFVRGIYGDDIDDPQWIKGFVFGAIAKYAEFKPHLQ